MQDACPGRPPRSLQALPKACRARAYCSSCIVAALRHSGSPRKPKSSSSALRRSFGIPEVISRKFIQRQAYPQLKGLRPHLLSPRDESNKGQAGKKERIDLRLRDDSCKGNDLPRVIDAGGLF